MTDDIVVHFKRMALSGGTLVVVAVGCEAYGVTHREPLAALHAVASKAAKDQALRGRSLDPQCIVERAAGTLARWLGQTCPEKLRRPAGTQTARRHPSHESS
jgi:hypothetical protein